MRNDETEVIDMNMILAAHEGIPAKVRTRLVKVYIHFSGKDFPRFLPLMIDANDLPILPTHAYLNIIGIYVPRNATFAFAR